jgi:poly-gamma-glutamate synthesis protein (capsule biosynthesis protein)
MKYVLTSIIVSILLTYSQPHNLFKTTKQVNPDSIKTITFSFVGDLMCHEPETDFASAGKDSLDYKPFFSNVKKFLTSTDFTIGNLETTLSGKENKFSGYPLFNTPDEFLDALKDAGFNFLITSNNHCLDRGEKGIIRTIDKIHERGLISTGTNKSPHDRDSIRIIEKNGIKTAILAYTFGVNGNYLSPNEKYMVNLIDTSEIKNDILSARTKNPDLILVYFHFGNEYMRQPSDYQKEIIKKTISYGAGLIICSHPHVIQPMEYFLTKDSKLKEGFIAYSLGNFISNQRKRYTDCGVILNFSISKNRAGEITLSNVGYLPTWVFKGEVDKKNEFVILPSDTSAFKLPSYLTKNDRTKLLQSFSDTKLMFKAVDDRTTISGKMN